ncbi:AEC family transporter, partial [uncultured Cohaesibacter sp.]|uniref:AEC family transporter n=1 Tax=uncultured Cohaesibacter sp. TaxID=1002546 RepID=UPI00292FAAD6
MASYWLTVFCASYILKKDFPTSAIYGLGTSASNSAYIGYPVASAIVGPAGAICMALNFIIENILITPMALISADMGSEKSGRLLTLIRQILFRLAKNPIIIGIILGLGISLTGISLPEPINKALSLLAAIASPTALFVIGGSLFGL